MYFQSFWGCVCRLWNGIHSIAHRPQCWLSVQSLRPRRRPTGVESLECPPDRSFHAGASWYAVAFSLLKLNCVWVHVSCAKGTLTTRFPKDKPWIDGESHGICLLLPAQITSCEFWEIFIRSYLQSPQIVPGRIMSIPKTVEFKYCIRRLQYLTQNFNVYLDRGFFLEVLQSKIDLSYITFFKDLEKKKKI